MPAMLVGISADCKVDESNQCCCFTALCFITKHALMQVVLVVLRALNMSAGKIGAQCAHAAVGLYKVLVANRVPWLSAWEVTNPVLH